VSGPHLEDVPLLVDVDGLPRRFEIAEARGQRRMSWLNVGVGLVYLAMMGVFGLRVLSAVLAAMYLLVGGLGLLLPRVHLRLEPEGVRRVGVLGRGQLTRWSEVGEVRTHDAWHTTPYLRGHGRFAETTDLGDMTVEQARELQRRLVEARRRAASTAPGDESDQAQV